MHHGQSDSVGQFNVLLTLFGLFKVTDSPSWISLAEFLRTSSLSMFQVWMQQVLVTFSQDLGSRLNMSTLVATVNSTPVRKGFITSLG